MAAFMYSEMARDEACQAQVGLASRPIGAAGAGGAAGAAGTAGTRRSARLLPALLEAQLAQHPSNGVHCFC